MLFVLGSGAGVRKLAGITDQKAASRLPAPLEISPCLADTNATVVFKVTTTDEICFIAPQTRGGSALK